MKSANYKLALYIFISVFLTFGLTISLQSILADWAGPTGDAPEENISAPIYSLSSDSQIITGGGGLAIAGPLAATRVAFPGWISGDGDDEGIYISSSGNVGIGTSTDINYNLTVVSEDFGPSLFILNNLNNPELAIGSSTEYWSFYQVNSSANNGDLRLWKTDNKLAITKSGRVGIGTVNPASSLDVAGGIKIGNDSECNLEKEGTVRYNSGSKNLSLCDGFEWKDIIASSTCVDDCSLGQNTCINDDQYSCGSCDADSCLDWCSASDCGEDSCGSYGANYCYNNDVYKIRTCYDRGCSGDACFSSSYIDRYKVTECGSDSCTDWQKYCYNGDVYERRTCTDKGCSSAVCFSNNTTETRLARDCVGTETCNSTYTTCCSARTSACSSAAACTWVNTGNSNMVGCVGSVVWSSASSLCGTGWHICSRSEFESRNNSCVSTIPYPFWLSESCTAFGEGRAYLVMWYGLCNADGCKDNYMDCCSWADGWTLSGGPKTYPKGTMCCRN